MTTVLRCATGLRYLSLPNLSELTVDAPEDVPVSEQFFLRGADDAWRELCRLSRLQELGIRSWPISRPTLGLITQLRSLRRFHQMNGGDDYCYPTPWYFRISTLPA